MSRPMTTSFGTYSRLIMKAYQTSFGVKTAKNLADPASISDFSNTQRYRQDDDIYLVHSIVWLVSGVLEGYEGYQALLHVHSMQTYNELDHNQCHKIMPMLNACAGYIGIQQTQCTATLPIELGKSRISPRNESTNLLMQKYFSKG